MNTTLVINAKGGVGKTTLATNLASYFATNGVPTTIADYDPQASSLEWLRRRPSHAPKIHGAHAAVRARTALPSIKRYVPSETRQLILDAPAGSSGLLLQDLLMRATAVLIPVGPSTIDVHVTADFVRDVFLVGGIRHRQVAVGVFANRICASSRSYAPLERFADSLRVPLLARIPESRAFVDAAEAGLGVFEMTTNAAKEQQKALMPILHWIEGVSTSSSGATGKLVRLLPPFS